jgi:hypothetical protein
MTTTFDRRTTPSGPPPSAVGRRLWIVFGSVFAVAALAYFTFTAVGLVAFARTSTHDVFAGDTARTVTRIDLRSDAGSARVIGSDRDDIVVDAKVTYGLQKPGNETRIEGDTLVVDSSCSAWSNTWCNVDYTIYVPRGVSVLARASGGGLRIEGIDGPVDASSSGGGLRLSDTGGNLRLASSGGGVRGERLRSRVVDADSSGGGVRLTFDEPPLTVHADSSGGGVTVEVPGPFPYNVDADSSGGGVDVSGVRHDPTSERSISVDSSGGGVTVRYTSE